MKYCLNGQRQRKGYWGIRRKRDGKWVERPHPMTLTFKAQRAWRFPDQASAMLALKHSLGTKHWEVARLNV